MPPTTQFTFAPAVRQRVKLKALVTGPSGSGKTFGALALATALFPGKVALIDSEHDRSEYYADTFEFQKVSLPNLQPSTYIAAVQAAAAQGFEVVVVDSLSHAWEDLLDRKDAEERAKPGSNSYTMWKKYGDQWGDALRALLEAPIHVICTARSKQAYEQTTDNNGKKKVVKLGMAPQLRDRTEIEFALVFDLLMSHSATISKDNTQMFNGTDTYDLTNGDLARQLKTWLNGGAGEKAPTRPKLARDEEAELQQENQASGQVVDQAKSRWNQPAPAPRVEAVAEQPLRVTMAIARDMTVRGRTLGELSSEKLRALIEWIDADAGRRESLDRVRLGASMLHTSRIAEEMAASAALKVGAATPTEVEAIYQHGMTDQATAATAAGDKILAESETEKDLLPF